MFVWSSFWLATDVPTIIWGPISFVLIGVTAVGAVVLYRFVRNRADLQEHALDERQRHLRDQAWVLSYQVLATVVIAIISYVGVVVLAFGNAITIDAGVANALVLCMGTLVPLLPGGSNPSSTTGSPFFAPSATSHACSWPTP
jgi:hypothetical protein